jgi:hypothetical protein
MWVIRYEMWTLPEEDLGQSRWSYMMVCLTCVLQVHALKKFYGIMQNSAKMT